MRLMSKLYAKLRIRTSFPWGLIMFALFSWGQMVLADTNCLPAPSLVAAWWPGDGNALDIIAGNNGLLLGGATASSNGICDRAFSFHSNVDSFSANLGSQLTIGNTPHSIEGWIFVRAFPTNRDWLMVLGNDGTGAHHWLINANGQMQVGVWNGNQVTPFIQTN
jgi:hypothetical protein